ncbi:site-2 protease family protein, partial [Candidatus Parcubacteria bacterium]|nr:site-2 protease family protein [Candidatus Parcubacteria bacterium]
MSILLFFAVLFILILVHEWGHFIVAKKTGMRVDEFGIGFPPRLFSLKKGETEYTFNALPIGGFVRIWGENGEDRSETDSSVDTSRGFNARPKWAQALVLIAGVTMNILFAWFLFSIINMLGVPVPVDEATATDAAELYVIGTISQSPAAVIPVGAVINTMMVGSELLSRPTPSEFTTVVQQAGETTVSVEYTSAGNTTTAELIPVRGLIESDPERYAVGASLSLVEVEKMGLVAAVTDGF